MSTGSFEQAAWSPCILHQYVTTGWRWLRLGKGVEGLQPKLSFGPPDRANLPYAGAARGAPLHLPLQLQDSETAMNRNSIVYELL